MSSIETSNWRQIREKGKAHFVLVHGILRFGVLAAILVTTIQCILNGPPADWVRLLVSNGAGAVAAGSCWGLALWYRGEKEFKKSERHSTT
jgi:hypothetical protein